MTALLCGNVILHIHRIHILVSLITILGKFSKPCRRSAHLYFFPVILPQNLALVMVPLHSTTQVIGSAATRRICNGTLLIVYMIEKGCSCWQGAIVYRRPLADWAVAEKWLLILLTRLHLILTHRRSLWRFQKWHQTRRQILIIVVSADKGVLLRLSFKCLRRQHSLQGSLPCVPLLLSNQKVLLSRRKIRKRACLLFEILSLKESAERLLSRLVNGLVHGHEVGLRGRRGEG